MILGWSSWWSLMKYSRGSHPPQLLLSHTPTCITLLPECFEWVIRGIAWCNHISQCYLRWFNDHLIRPLIGSGLCRKQCMDVAWNWTMHTLRENALADMKGTWKSKSCEVAPSHSRHSSNQGCDIGWKFLLLGCEIMECAAVSLLFPWFGCFGVKIPEKSPLSHIRCLAVFARDGCKALRSLVSLWLGWNKCIYGLMNVIVSVELAQALCEALPLFSISTHACLVTILLTIVIHLIKLW